MSFAPGILEGKSAVVTGGATGIGAHIVRMLGSLGANVGIVSRKESNLIAAANAFKTDNDIDVKWQVGDVRDPDADRCCCRIQHRLDTGNGGDRQAG